ncbi:PREDICTED: uncharacterized protein LOC105556240 isoform X2 [Vollenhovia emeryi]|uniref:uncharacterized protein LOC105556240 isoform X1 n=1 Tax=Vollenhovia emeryi TaxID=411798 RepID=UPI0005F51AB0|nr:PREDICTED: uncharacterized protein LOC105556240 isoform X1 [Vollenhovia emeryi]XP_011858713.1 PREDICTED: uncharacterized protein LOC105556240 isoform X2 [Vollenhovia emeryi]
MIHCPNCLKILFSINALQIHLKRSHNINTRHGSFSPFSCSEPKCGRRYSSWKSFRQHLIKFHLVRISCKTHVDPLYCKSQTPSTSKIYADSLYCKTQTPSTSKTYIDSLHYKTQTSSTENMISSDIHDNDNALLDKIYISNLSTSPPNFSLNIDDLKKQIKYNAMSFIKEMYAIPNIPRNHVQVLVDKVNELVSLNVSRVRDFVKSQLASKNLLASAMIIVDNYLEVLQNSFDGLSSEFLRLKEIKEDGSSVEPKEIIVGD